MTRELIENLKHVHWNSNEVSSALLTSLGIAHGFEGKIPSKTFEQMSCHHVKQVHGTKIIPSSQETKYPHQNLPEADGVYSLDQEKVAVKTADCLPILIASKDKDFMAAVHGGWRGVSQGILFSALDLIQKYSDPQKTVFVIGPAISRESFEVGPEVVDAIYASQAGLRPTASSALAISKGRADRWHIDLNLVAVLQLLSRGIDPHQIEVIQSCTVKEKNPQRTDFYWNSYRREGKGVASNWSWVGVPT